jgi:hypothetical protein
MTRDSKKGRRAAALCVASVLATFALLHGENANAYWEEVDVNACQALGTWAELVCPLQDNATYRFDQATRARAYVRNDAAHGVTVSACVSAAQEFGFHCGAPKSKSSIGWVTLDPSLSEWLSGLSGFPYLKVSISAGWYSGYAVTW